jgi:uracil-DNA glycosylase family 4
MDKYQTFDEDLRSCRKCAELLRDVPVDPSKSSETVVPKPIVSGIRQKPVFLLGQAPGLTEYETGRPFQGPAGQKIRGIFAEIGLRVFDDLVFSSAVVKCYPGRKFRKRNIPASGCEDRVPPRSMVTNCRPLLERQLDLVAPKVLVTLGSFPLKAYLELSGQRDRTSALEQFVGRKEEWGTKTVVFFPHTSGGARWLNSPANRALFIQAKEVLRKTLIEREVVDA